MGVGDDHLYGARAPAAVSRLSMPHAATTKGCLILCTVLGLTSNLTATPRMVSPAFRAARIRSSSWRAMRGRPSFLPSSLAPRSGFMQRVESGPLIPPFAAAYPVILINLADLPAGTLGDLPQLALLIGRGLVDCGNPEVESGTFHGKYPFERQHGIRPCA